MSDNKDIKYDKFLSVIESLSENDILDKLSVYVGNPNDVYKLYSGTPKARFYDIFITDGKWVGSVWEIPYAKNIGYQIEDASYVAIATVDKNNSREKRNYTNLNLFVKPESLLDLIVFLKSKGYPSFNYDNLMVKEDFELDMKNKELGLVPSSLIKENTYCKSR